MALYLLLFHSNSVKKNTKYDDPNIIEKPLHDITRKKGDQTKIKSKNKLIIIKTKNNIRIGS